MNLRPTKRLVSSLKSVARSRGYSLVQLSREIDVAQSTLSMIAGGGRSVDAVILIKICDRLNCQPGDIISILPS